MKSGEAVRRKKQETKQRYSAIKKNIIFFSKTRKEELPTEDMPVSSDAGSFPQQT